MNAHYVGIDVGSASVRAAVFDPVGTCLAQAARPIARFRPEPNFVEQSSDDIWDACVTSVHEAVAEAGIVADSVRAIGFDATCSLVALAADGTPVSVSPTDDDAQNIVMWLEGRTGQELTRDPHVLDYHHGNRSPLADASLTGIVTGLTLAESIDALAVRYLATLQAVSYGTRHIVEALNNHGHAVSRLRLCGGVLKNERWLRETADATGLTIELPAETETVLLGGAMLAATACGEQPDLQTAAARMSGTGRVIIPRAERRAFHDAKYRVYRTLHADQLAYRQIMAGASVAAH